MTPITVKALREENIEIGGVTHRAMALGTDYHGMAKLSGPRAKVRMWFDSGTELRLHLDGDRGPGLGAIFVGEDGKIEINRGRFTSNPSELAAEALKDQEIRTGTAIHIKNWVDCIISRDEPNAPIEVARELASEF